MSKSPSICPDCGKEFKKDSGLAGHMMLAHGKKWRREKPQPEKPEKKESKRASACLHEFRDLSRNELGLVNPATGKTIADEGFKYVCKLCSELR